MGRMNWALLQTWLSKEFLGNTLQTYLSALGIFLGALALLWLLKVTVVLRLRKWAKRTENQIDDFLINLLAHLGPIVYVLVALYVATQSLTLSAGVTRAVHFFFVVVITYKVVQILQAVAAFGLNNWASRMEPEDPTSAVVVKNLLKAMRVALWVAGFIFVMDNLGVNITSVVAGLGIGGVAIALASQAILGDAFSAFAIFMDKPFKVGEFVILEGGYLGTIEYIGFKTTRIRSLGGELIVMSNTDLTNSRIRNYKRMQQRRVVFKLGVVYQTSLEQAREIPRIIRQIIESSKMARFDRSHFQSYGDFALIFESVYYVLSPDYNTYMDVQQEINLRIKEAFEKRNIEFAYPTQQIFVTRVEPPA